MEKYVKIICILDRSGSMSSIIEDAIGGFNTFLNEQQEVKGDATMTILQFDTEFNTICVNRNIKEVEFFNRHTYVPRGGTSLYDAIGMTIEKEIDWLSNTPQEERPEKSLCVILTDGDENSSRNFKSEQIKEMIEEMREDFKWEFIFLAANQDAFAASSAIGISKGNTLNFAATGDGVRGVYSNVSAGATTYRTTTSDKYENLLNEKE